MTQKHTPTPWKVDENAINDNMGFEIALIASDMRTWQEDDANAAHIVKCVNMHDELVEALKLAHNGIVSYSRDDKEATVTMIREALKKAGAL